MAWQQIVCVFLMTQVTSTLCGGLTDLEKQQVVDIHNSVRRQEGSSNMPLMTYNEDLGKMAQTWAETCNYVHGNPTDRPAYLVNVEIGQNLNADPSNTSIIEKSVMVWYNEKVYYNSATGTCNGGTCGHYTQVVSVKSNQVGCGYAQCTPTRFNVVCNYLPAGNKGGEPYRLKGPACSNCTSGTYYCNNGLCDSSCTAAGPNCVCQAKCQNCGTVTPDCRCKCAKGWMGNDCSAVCKEGNSNCNAGYYKSDCNPDTGKGQFIIKNCPVMCGTCVAGPPDACS